MMCVTTTDMREGCCAVRDDKSCNNNCIGDDSGVRKSESTDISCYNIRNCDGNNNDVISHKPRRKKYILRLVCVNKEEINAHFLSTTIFQFPLEKGHI